MLILHRIKDTINIVWKFVIVIYAYTNLASSNSKMSLNCRICMDLYNVHILVRSLRDLKLIILKILFCNSWTLLVNFLLVLSHAIMPYFR